MRSVILNGGLRVRKVILRINLRRETSRKELSIGTNAVKELFDFGEVSSGDVEMNVVAADGRRKRRLYNELCKRKIHRR